MVNVTRGGMADGSAGAPRRAGAVPATGVVLSLTGLLLTAPPPPAAVTVLAGAASSSDPTAPLVAAVALAAWAVSGWLALTVVLLLLARLPGLLGDAGRVLAARVAPATVRRTVEAALGLTVAVGALAPATAVAAAPPGPAAAAGAAGIELAWDLDWPSSTAASPEADRPTATRPPTPSPPADRPTASPPGSPTPSATRTTTPAAPRAGATSPGTRPPTAPPRTAAPSVARPTPDAIPAAGPAAVVVRPGDSLWSLAEASLHRSGAEPTDRQVAEAWPRWWAANREVVGEDPDLLVPGAVLLPPPPGAGGA